MTETGHKADLVWVELAGLRVVRIFRSRKDALHSTHRDIGLMRRNEAVGDIRTQVFNRAGWHCERCGTPLTYQTGQMDERVSKGEGGEVSLDNCWLLCHGCHQGRPDAEHGNRQPQFGKARQHGE